MLNRKRERELLKAVLRKEARESSSTPSRSKAWNLTGWLCLFLVFFSVFHWFGIPAGREWAWVVLAFLVGLITGSVAMNDLARQQWTIWRRFMDFDRIRARVSELDRG